MPQRTGQPQAVTEARQAAELMLDVLGERAPASDVGGDDSGNIRLRLPRSLHATLSRLATAEGVSLNQLMVTLLSRAEALSASAEGEARGLARAEGERAAEDAKRILIEGTKAPTRPRDPRDRLAFAKDRGRGKLEKRPAGRAAKKATA